MRRQQKMIALPEFAQPALASMLRRQPLTAGKVAFAWQIAAGANLARAVAAEFRAPDTIRLRPKDPRWATELEHSRPVLTDRLKVILGIANLTLEIQNAGS